jgi:tight adherence protein C
MGTLGVVIAGLLIMIAIVVVMIARGGAGSGENIDDRLNELASLGEPITLEKLEMSQSFTQRVLIPMGEKLTQMSQRFTPENMLQQAEQQLMIAGMSHQLTPAQFYAIRVGASAGLGILAFLATALIGNLSFIQRLGGLIGGALLGYILPNSVISSKMKSRQSDIVKALPDALDLLTICVEAGLGFDAAMSKVGEKWDNELSLAFTRAVQEMQLGKSRRESLRDMANGADVPDMTSFVAAIIQADQLGVSMVKVMRIQSEQMRMKRKQRAEEKARQAPVKIMIPLVFFIFPTILIVLLGPAYFQVRDSGASNSS